MDKQAIDQEASWLGARLREPSTYVGIAALLAGVVHLPAAAQWATVITDGGLALGGLLGIVLPEGK
jgi:hypothetical protein